MVGYPHVADDKMPDAKVHVVTGNGFLELASGNATAVRTA
jgi:hypothetical protein